ncbi:PREDICTED: HAUS augmin-like complex subunit 6 [Nipponia nippon]|nr:PREDICTED: HAUS augmin-like complex subunit 6 [Nipponia nippon]
MFDKPNSGAFHAIALFLFAKLDKRRAAKTFRHCSFPLATFSNPEFRKQCCMWLKDIANEDQSCLPRITPSSLISPGGPKFIQLFHQFARHVMIEDMKRNSVGTDIPFAEAVRLSPEDMYMADARRRVAYNKLLQIFQKEDFVIEEYKKKAQLLIKEINQIKSEYAVLQIQSCKMKQNDQNKNDKTERIQKVRSMWTLIMGMLTSLKKEKEVVDSVLHLLEDCVGQYILDGTNVVFSVPQLLLHRVENDIHQLCTGNVYEAEKLNFLTVIQLLNEALRTLRDEHCQYEFEDLHVIENRITLCNKILQDLAAKRLTIEQEHCVSTSGSISRKQEDWEEKWKSFLGPCLFNLILDQDPPFCLLRASSPDSSGLAEEEDNDDDISVICQQLVSCSDVYDSVSGIRYEKDDEALETMMEKSTPPPRCHYPLPRISSEPLELSKACENKDMLIEKNLHIETCKGEKKPVPPKILKNGKDESATSEMRENAGDHVIQTESPVKKEDPLEKARDELAEEVAKTVISESPQSSEGKEMALEDLISSMAFNPFLTRKEIPRTPENLLTEIRSSWRKAIQTEASSDIELVPAEVVIEEAPMDAGPVMQKAEDSRFVCSTHASLVHDIDPPLSERKSQLSYTEFRPQEQMRISHIESEILEASGMQESERTEEEELKCIVLNKSYVEDTEEQTFPHVKKSMNIPNTCSENNSRTNVLPSDHFWSSLMDGMLHRNVSPQLSPVTHQDHWLGILDETFPEELDNIDSNKSASSGSYFDIMDKVYVTDGSKNKDDIKKYEQPFQNTYEALKKTAFRSEEELHQTHNGGESVCCRSDLSLAPEKRQRGELCSPLECFCLDEEVTKIPSPISPSERKYSLSSLLVSCQHLEEMASMVHEIPLDIIHKLKDKEQLNEKPGMKEPTSE